MTNKDKFLQWRGERDEAVASLDIVKFKAFYKKWKKLGFYNRELPNDNVVELAVHKMALEITTLPQEIKYKALVWLIEHNSKPIDWESDNQ